MALKNEECEKEEVVVVMAPLPAQGHMNQLLHLSRLVAGYGVPVHFVGGANHNKQAKQRVHGWDPECTPNIHFHDMATPAFPSPSPDPSGPSPFPSHLVPAFRFASAHLRRPIGALLHRLSLSSRKVVVIHDSLMASAVQDVGAIPNAESFTFHSVSAFAIFLFYWEGAKGAPLLLPKIVPSDVPSLDGCMTPDMLDFIAAQYHFNKLNSGNLYNTTRLIENPYVDSLARILPTKKHWAIGPFNPVAALNDNPSPFRHACLDWLDLQGSGSVVYVSFGTTTAFKEEQIREMALGLERSGEKFMWVLREADKGDVLAGKAKEIMLPEGFEERVRGRGLVVRDWAPQLEILGHKATGGFVSHCGWNSCVESMSSGVTIGAWPMHSDQPRNTVLVTQVLNVGVVVRDWMARADLATAETVANGVKRLMAAAEVRTRAAELGAHVRRSLTSKKELDAFIAHITR